MLLLHVQNIRVAKVKVKVGFLNMVVSSSIFPTLLPAPLLSVCFSSWCICSAVCPLENLSTYVRLSVQEKLSVTELFFKCFKSCGLNLQISDHMPI